jgi:PPOX class probable F420-dependent enzyme
MDSLELSPDVRAFLDAVRYGVMATHDPDGAIWQAVVWYAMTDEGILMNSRDGRRWSTNLAHDPRASLAVEDGEAYVILRGEARVLYDLDRGMADAKALAVRYGSDPAEFDGQRRVSVLMTPRRIGLHGRLAEAAAPKPEAPAASG